MQSNIEQVRYRLAREQDLPHLAEIYCSLYTDATIEENWDQLAAYSLLRFFYDTHPDIFVVAAIGTRVVGAIASFVKPWWDGNRLVETEVFVEAGYQKHGIGSRLFREHFKLAMERYDAKVIEAHTYEEPNGYPLLWYCKQGYKVEHDLFVISGEIEKIYKDLKSR